MPVTIIQWLVFRGVGHAQTGVNAVIETLPTVACGRTSWPGIYRYSQYQPKHVCPDCAMALGIAAPAKRQTASAESAVLSTTENTEHTEKKGPVGPAKPKQGQLF